MPGIQQFNLGGGASPASPQDVYPLMERMIASMDSAAERIGGNIRQSMMQNQANSQAKDMANDAQALLQQNGNNPQKLTEGIMGLVGRYPLAAQGPQGQMIIGTLGARANTLAAMPVMVSNGTAIPSGTGGGGQGQPTGVDALSSDGGIAAGVTPSGSGAPSGMIPTAPTGGPMAQPTVQVNGQQQQPDVGQSTGAATPPSPLEQFSVAEKQQSDIIQQYAPQIAQANAILSSYPAQYPQNKGVRADAERQMREAQMRAGQAQTELARIRVDKAKFLYGAQKDQQKDQMTQQEKIQKAEEDTGVPMVYNQGKPDFAAHKAAADAKKKQEARTAAGDLPVASVQETEKGFNITYRDPNSGKASTRSQTAFDKEIKGLGLKYDDFENPQNWKPVPEKKAMWLETQDTSGKPVNITISKDHFDKLKSEYDALTGAGATPKPKPLDPATAQQFLQQAGGDKDKARDLAKQAGYTF